MNIHALLVGLLAGAVFAASTPSVEVSRTNPDSIDARTCGTGAGCLRPVFRPWPDTARDAAGRPVAALGPVQSLLPDATFPELQYLPDEGSALMPVAPGRTRLLLAGPGVSYLLSGTGNLGNVRWNQATKVLDSGAATDFDNGYAGTGGAWTDPSGKVWAFYHAEDHVDIPKIPGTSIAGFYASIGWATSTDSGRTWTKHGPLIRTRAAKIVHDPSRTDQGAAEPGVAASPDENWLHVAWSDHSRPGGEGVRICLSRMRMRDGVPVPTSCRTWNGTDFASPCLGGDAEPVLRSDLVLGARWRGDALEGHPAWIHRLGKYAMVFGIWPWQGVADTSRVGTWMALSTDMVHWERPVRLIHDLSIPQAGRSLSWEATLLPDGASDSTAWLVYGQTPHWPDQTGGRGHRPVRRHLLWLEKRRRTWGLEAP